MKNFYSTNKYLLIIVILFFSACGSSDDETEVIIVPEITTLTGNYTGSWSSTTATATFSGVSISAKLIANADETRLVGEFFISLNFVSPYGSTNDGTIIIDINSNKEITSFTYNDVIPNCSGTFTGTGRVTDTGVIIIDFTGTDCDGDHVGQITLSK